MHQQAITPINLQLPSAVRYVLVDTEQDGQRLDNFLLTALKGVPRSLVYRVLRTGEVRVNKGRAKAGYRVRDGDQIRLPPLRLPDEAPPVSPPAGQLRQLEAAILYEDSRLLVVNKPAGLAVHGGSGMSHGVIEAFRVMRTQHLELVHRLDRDTSGCLVITKRRSMLRWLHQTMQDGTFAKCYLALLAGVLEHKTIQTDVPLRKNTLQGGERIVRVDETGKPSRTSFQRLRQFAYTTLTEVRPYSGRTHQIRVHAAHLRLPVAGDEKYGNKEANATLRTLGLRRLFLHAAALTIPMPDGQPPLEIKAPLDPLLEGVLSRLSG